MLKRLWKLFMWITFILVCLALWEAPDVFDKDQTSGAVITFFAIAMFYRARYNRLRDCMHIQSNMKANDLLRRRLKEREEEERKREERVLKRRKQKQRWGLRL